MLKPGKTWLILFLIFYLPGNIRPQGSYIYTVIVFYWKKIDFPGIYGGI